MCWCRVLDENYWYNANSSVTQELTSLTGYEPNLFPTPFTYVLSVSSAEPGPGLPHSVQFAKGTAAEQQAGRGRICARKHPKL